MASRQKAGRKQGLEFRSLCSAMGLGVLLFALCPFQGCVPPSVEELSGPPLPSLIHVNLALVAPPGEEISLVRKPDSFLVFDVRDAFDNIAEEGEELFYYWYVDWDSDNLVEPVAAGEDSLQYFACVDEYDPPLLSGNYPQLRTLMVVATNQPLQEPSQAYLSQEENLIVAMVDWTIFFEGNSQCVGGEE